MTPIPYSELKKLTFNHITSSESDDITTYNWSFNRSIPTDLGLVGCPFSVLLYPEDIIYAAINSNFIAHKKDKTPISVFKAPSVYQSLYLDSGSFYMTKEAVRLRRITRVGENTTITIVNNGKLCDPDKHINWYKLFFMVFGRDDNLNNAFIKRSHYEDAIFLGVFYPYMDVISYLFHTSVFCVGDRIKNLANIKNDVIFRKDMLEYEAFVKYLYNKIALRDKNVARAIDDTYTCDNVTYGLGNYVCFDVNHVQSTYPSLGVTEIKSIGYASCGDFNTTHRFLLTDAWDSTLPSCPTLIVNETKASLFFAMLKKNQSVKCEDIFVSTKQDGISYCPSCLFIDSNFTVNNNNTKVQQCSEQIDGTFIHFFPTYQNRLYNYPDDKYTLPQWNMSKLYVNLEKYYDVMCTSNCFYFNANRKQPIKTTKDDLTSAFVFIEDPEESSESSNIDIVIAAFVGVAVTLKAISWTLFCLFYDRNRRILDQMKENR